ncbi:MAG: Mu-like prophage major head subunit gpT family protein [Lachnospiraceae bacterium]|nr:Mu-like prophage major head subunit gpT family protein [Lachnospiraceae bacterium]
MIITSQGLQGMQSVFNALFNKAYTETTPQYEKVAMTVPSGGSDETYGWLGQFPALREWIGEREIHNLDAIGYTIKNKDYELTISVGRNDILDDKIGIYSPLFQEMGVSAKMHPDELIFSLFAAGFSNACYDGTPFFNEKHPLDEKGNTLQSNMGTQKLSPQSYEAARSQMMTIKGESGKTLKIIPDLLVVSPQKEATARQILFADLISGSTNVNKNTSDLLVVPELADTPEYWFLLATKRAIKPFIFQMREKPRFVSKVQDGDDNVFFQNTFLYGCNARYNAGYGLWQLAYGSTGSDSPDTSPRQDVGSSEQSGGGE